MGKCSLCGEQGHNKRTCKLNDVKRSTETQKVKKQIKQKQQSKQQEKIEEKQIVVNQEEYKKEEKVNECIKSEYDIKQQFNALKNVNTNDEIYMISYKGISYIYHEKDNDKLIVDSKSNIIGSWKNGQIIFNSSCD